MNDEHNDPRHGPEDPALLRRLHDEAQHVSPAVAARLAAMRRAAVGELDQSGERSPGPRWPALLWPGAGLATAAAVSLALLVTLNGPDLPANGHPLDPDTMSVVENLDLLDELEFIAWLDETEIDAG